MEKNCAKMSKLKILLALLSQCFGKPTTKKEDKDEARGPKLKVIHHGYIYIFT